MKKSIHILLLLSVLIIATFFRLYQIKTIPPGLYPDEAINGNNALEALRTGSYKLFYPENNGREGLFINIQAFFLKILGGDSFDFEPKPWMLRLPSAFFGILTVLGIYFFIKELFSESKTEFFEQRYKLSLVAAFFLATNFWHVNFSRIGFRAIMAPFFLIWSLYFLLKSFKSIQVFNFCFFSALAGLLFGLGFHTYIAYRIMPLLIIIILIYFYLRLKKEEQIKKFKIISACFLFFVLLAAFPLGIYFVKNPQDFWGRTSQISIFNSATPFKDLANNIIKTAAMFNIRGDGNWRHNYANQPELFWPVGILFLVGLILTIKNTLKNIKFFLKSADIQALIFPFFVLFFWFVLAAIPVVISNEGIPHALRSILMLPPAIIFAALGGIWVYQKFSTKSSGLAGALKNFSLYLFLFSLVIHSYFTYFVFWANDQNTAWAFDQSSLVLGERLNSLPKNVQKYVIVETRGVEVPIVDGLSGKIKLIPMSAQTVMFITNTYLAKNQQTKNIYYLVSNEEKTLPADAAKFYIK